jgi:DNA replication protein DnaC
MTGRDSGGGFQRIGGPSLQTLERLAQFREQARRQRLETIQERGWLDTVQCLSCGDRGYQWRPDGTGPSCDCVAGQAIEQREQRERHWRASVPGRLTGYRLATSPQPGAARLMSRWLDSAPWETGENALLIGPVGTGKTGLAIGAMRAAHDAGRSTELIIVSDWLIRQRPNSADEAIDPMDQASRPDLLVIDDLGTQKNSEWVHERLYVLVNRRYLDCKPTIVTSNHQSLDLLRESLGDRATSRLLEQCRIVPVEGPDLRQGGRT